MTGSIIVINVDIRETRVALVEGGVIAELQIERASHRGTVGNIVLGKVTRVLPGMQAAFIDVGQERSAFLHVEDLIRPDDFEIYLSGGADEQNESFRGTGERKATQLREEEADEDDEGDESEAPAPQPLLNGAILEEEAADSDDLEPELDDELDAVADETSASAEELLDEDGAEDESSNDELGEDEEDDDVPEIEDAVEDDESEDVESGDDVDLDDTEVLDSDLLDDSAEEDGSDDGMDEIAPMAASPAYVVAEATVLESASAQLIDVSVSVVEPDSRRPDRADGALPKNGRAVAVAATTSPAPRERERGSADRAGPAGKNAAGRPARVRGDSNKPEAARAAEPGNADGARSKPGRSEATEAEAAALDTGRARGVNRQRGRNGQQAQGSRGRRGRQRPNGSASPSPAEDPKAVRGRRAVRGKGGPAGGGSGRQSETSSAPTRVTRSVPITEVVSEGDMVVVQISKEPIGTKGARVTSHVSLPGRYVVYLPTVDHLGISKRIGSARERQRLRQVMESLKPARGGLIVRTVAEGLTKKQLKADVGYLIRVWAEVCKRRETAKPAEELYTELDLVLKVARDLFTDEVKSIVIDDREQYARLVRFVEMFLPERVKDIELYTGSEPIFDAYGIEDEIGRALSRKVPLPSGGSLIVDQAEALTAIDVNTGRYVGKGSKDLEETALKTNLEAVEEIAYQLRFRNIGGLVILDLIDMEKYSSREKVWRALETALVKDKAKTTLNRISELGLIEMTRKRTRESLGRMLHEPCFYCDGTGQIQSKATIGYEILRQIGRERHSLPGYSVVVNAHPAIVDFLKTVDRAALDEAERRYTRRIELAPRTEYHIEQYDLQGK
jgi:ribonuclease G